jgi:hypothetical protein
MSPFWLLSLLGAFLLLTAVPLLALGGGRAYLDLLAHHPGLLLGVGLAWAAGGSWLLRRGAEFLLFRRSGAKLKADG